MRQAYLSAHLQPSIDKDILPTVTVLLVKVACVAIPLIAIWGWIRWFKRPRLVGAAILSLVGFVLATLSIVLAISSVLYARAIGGFPFQDPMLLWIFRWGGLLSASGALFAIFGVWRASSLRWHALACSLACLVFWMIAGAGE